MKGTVYSIGTVTADVYHQPPPLDSEQSSCKPAGKLNYYLGGIATNIAVGLSHFKVPVELIAKLGPDQLGKTLLAVIDCHQIKYQTNLSGKPTSVIVVNPKTSLHDVTYDAYSQGTAYSDLTPPDLPKHTTKDDIIVISSTIFSHYQLVDSFLTTLRTYRDNQTMITLDLNIRKHHDQDVAKYRNYTKELMEVSSLIKGTLDEFRFMYQIGPDTTDTELLGELARNFSDDTLYLITVGSSGCLFYQNHRYHKVEATPLARPNDLVGAGDSFLVGCLVRYLRGTNNYTDLLTNTKLVTEMCDYGNRVAKIIIQYHGSTGYSVLDPESLQPL